MSMRLVGALVLCAFVGAANAFPITFSGSIDDPLNPDLYGSDLGLPSFDDSVFPIADNVAIYTFSVSTAQTVTFTSSGATNGGFQPYFSLFSGLGPGAAFLASNYDDAFFGDGGDFVLAESLAPGDYTVAISVFANMSFAENLGSGSLGDGFIFLGFGDLGNGGYDVVADAAAPPQLPEPAPFALLGAGVFAAFATRRRVVGLRT
jgi:hypothetical protein